VSNPDDISSILEVLERSEDLKLTYEKYNEKIDDLRAEKDSLAERLHMLSVSHSEKQHVTQTFSTHTEDEDHYSHKIAETEKIMQHYQNKFSKQNTIYSTCKLGIEQLRRTLKIGDEYSVETIEVEQLIENILDKLDYYTEKVRSTIGTLEYKAFESLFPEV
jgi:chromosome segregation ATPase